MAKFTIDNINSDDEYLYVDIEGVGTVIIKAGDEGVSVDVCPLHVVNEPVVSTWATYAELIHVDGTV